MSDNINKVYYKSRYSMICISSIFKVRDDLEGKSEMTLKERLKDKTNITNGFLDPNFPFEVITIQTSNHHIEGEHFCISENSFSALIWPILA